MKRKWKKSFDIVMKLFAKCGQRQKEHGYGLALLMVFLASSVLLATSMSLILAPGVVSYISSFNTTSAAPISVQIANAALDAARSDILNQLSKGNTVDTSYRYPASGTNQVTMPTYPGSGATQTVGTYYVTATKARGYTYILQAAVTVNGMTKTVSRLFQMGNSGCPTTNSYFAYSLRKICSSYTGKALNVRRSSDNATQDIGFVGSDFDVASFRTFLGKDLPLNVNSTAKAAYSLRKLNSSYSGSAIKVRRSSGSPTTLDIGFNSFGNLDTKSLLTFVGTGSGYIDTWYDQSGYGRNVTQSTTSQQPRIVNAGVLETVNGIPTVRFISANPTSLATTSVPLAAGQSKYTYFAVTKMVSTTSTDFAIMDQTAATRVTGGEAGLSTMHTGTYGFNGDTNMIEPVTTPSNLFQTTLAVDNTQTNNITIYTNEATSSSTNVASSGGAGGLSVGAYWFTLGFNNSSGGGAFDGYLSEAIVYDSILSASNRTAIQNNEGQYYKISSLQDGFVTTWYDQSGNGINLTQATTTAQPIIDLSGSAPAIFFDSRLCQSNGAVTCEYLGNSSLSKTLTPMTMTALGVGQITANSATSWSGRLLSIYQTGSSDDSNASSALIMNYYSTNPITLGSKKDSDSSLSVSHTWGQDFQATSIADGTNRSFRSYQTSTGLVTGTTTAKASESLVINNIRVGINNGPTVNDNAFWDGRINEMLFYTTVLPTVTYQAYESNQRTYFGI